MNTSRPAIVRDFNALFTTPIDSRRHWGIIAVVALTFILTPQLTPNDWARNTAGLTNGLGIYRDPGYVYPPWGLILLWSYYLMTAVGARVASVLAVGWLAQSRGWSLARFGAIIAGPFFIWTMVLSNVDVLALLLPVVLWESVEGKRWEWLGRGVALAVLLVKPQGSLPIIAYWLWTNRHEWRGLIAPLLLVALVVVPTSLIGSPPLLLQWLDNIRNPSPVNQEFWAINNVSLSDHLGPLPAVVIVGATLTGLYALMRFRERPWTRNHTLSALFLVSMLLSPYASNQGVIVPLAFVPSWPAVLIQYTGALIGSFFEVYREFSAWWALLFGLSALWLFRPTAQNADHDRQAAVKGIP